MNFASILDTLHAADGGYRVTVTDDWAQGRATFGGLITGVANEMLRQLIPRERVLRSLQTTFVGPAAQAKPQAAGRGYGTTLSLCFYAIPDAKPLCTFAGIALTRQRSKTAIDRPVSRTQRWIGSQWYSAATSSHRNCRERDQYPVALRRSCCRRRCRWSRTLKGSEARSLPRLKGILQT